MRILPLILFMALIMVGCATTDGKCAACGSKDCTCEACPVTGKTGDCPEAACSGCAELAAGGTGWCAECDQGYFEGRLVNCTGGCKANPGGPPCSACVK
jgi:hypothetical protein